MHVTFVWRGQDRILYIAILITPGNKASNAFVIGLKTVGVFTTALNNTGRMFLRICGLLCSWLKWNSFWDSPPGSFIDHRVQTIKIRTWLWGLKQRISFSSLNFKVICCCCCLCSKLLIQVWILINLNLSIVKVAKSKLFKFIYMLSGEVHDGLWPGQFVVFTWIIPAKSWGD